MSVEISNKAVDLLDEIDSIFNRAASQRRPLSASEKNIMSRKTQELEGLSRQAWGKKGALTPKRFYGEEPVTGPRPQLARDYHTAFWHYLGRGDRHENNAALYEGSSPLGGYAVPVEVDGKIVPLAPNDYAVRQLSLVIPTTKDLKLPIEASIATAAAKAEGDGTGSNIFGKSDPSFTQKTLSAFMTGDTVETSWEIAQDVVAMLSFVTDDLTRAVQTYEEDKFLNGSGSGEPEGILTVADVGVAHSAVDLSHILDLIGSLKEAYLLNASFLMARSTATAIRKSQVGANLYEPVWTRENGQDFLYGYPVRYSSSMPTSGQLSSPIVFGDFRQGYLIGDRGGSAIEVKVLDQIKAVEGIIPLLGYRRTDGRVRRTEALKRYVIDSGS